MTSRLPGPPGGEILAGLADPARGRRRALRAVEAAGQDAGAGGLAAAARAAEQVGVVGAVVAQRLHQRLGDVLLADDVGERLGAVAAVQRLRHAATLARLADIASGRSTGMQGPLAHPPEPAYPCCLPALGEFSGMTPHEGSTGQPTGYDDRPAALDFLRVWTPTQHLYGASGTGTFGRTRPEPADSSCGALNSRAGPRRARAPVSSPAEDSPSWPMAHAWKACWGQPPRGFESRVLRSQVLAARAGELRVPAARTFAQLAEE